MKKLITKEEKLFFSMMTGIPFNDPMIQDAISYEFDGNTLKLRTKALIDTKDWKWCFRSANIEPIK